MYVQRGPEDTMAAVAVTMGCIPGQQVATAVTVDTVVMVTGRGAVVTMETETQTEKQTAMIGQ